MLPRGVLIAAVLAGGCKKKQTEPVEAPVRVNPPDIVTLQVVTVSPNTLPVGVPTSVMVIGAGFQQGAMVRVGQVPASSANFRNPNQIAVNLPALSLGTYDLAVINPDANESVLPSALSVRAAGPPELAVADCRHIVVYFGTDQTTLAPDAAAALDNAMGCWQSLEVPIRIDGHADERGTTDYNLALGQRRALAVREYLVNAGIPRTRMPVTSYGEERPLASGWGEQAWAQNRRVELVIE